MKPRPGIYVTVTSVICVTINMLFYGLPIHHKVLKSYVNARNSINHLAMETPNILSFVQIHCHKMDYFAQQSPNAIIYTCTGLQVCVLRLKLTRHNGLSHLPLDYSLM